MPKTRDGEKITWKEFMKRWKKGMEGVTPLQQTKSQMNGIYIMMFGMIAGIVISLTQADKMWWLAVILIGGLFNTGVQWLGMWQKKNMLMSFQSNVDVETLLEGGKDNELIK